ncbi:hypothetical protein QWY16_03835 [Planococcus shenhongbingii]|uniref:hypothetical protein n=1 Tax=Planococcus shenhongbingii TaxID=3058398 RepID=UPI00262F2C83|nr:hypothetical protein [Planococcus sp. N016]WKA59294.1 hypothetical protein QWY16_03835 [Planococcus sp. N016]
MTYFVDHLKKRIHRRQFAGDACGFLSTPIGKREFTDSHTYILQLEEKDAYSECLNCQSFQVLAEQV